MSDIDLYESAYLSHGLTERNSLVKFNENQSNGSGDMEEHKIEG